MIVQQQNNEKQYYEVRMSDNSRAPFMSDYTGTLDEIRVRPGEKFVIPENGYGVSDIGALEYTYDFFSGTYSIESNGCVRKYMDGVIEEYQFPDDIEELTENDCMRFSVQKYTYDECQSIGDVKWGYCAIGGCFKLVSAQYEDALAYNNDSGTTAVKKDGKWLFIHLSFPENQYDCDMSEVDGQRYDQVDGPYLDTGYFSYAKKEWGGGRGLIDQFGRVVFMPHYDTMPIPLPNKTFLACKNGEIGILNRKGEILVPFGEYAPKHTPEYTVVNPGDWNRHDPALIVNKGGKYCVYSHAGRPITDTEYDYIQFYCLDRLMLTYKAGKWGALNIYGKEILPNIYDFIGGSSCDFIQINLNGKIGHSNLLGEIVIPIIYDGFSICCNMTNTLAGRIGEKWQILKADGVESTPLIYDKCRNLHYGYFLVEMDGEKYVTDCNGNRQSVMIDWVFPGFRWAGSSVNAADVSYLGKMGTMSRNGTSIIPCIYDDLRPLVEGQYEKLIALLNGMSGVISNTNDVIIPFEYDEIKPIFPNTDYIAALKNGKWGELDIDGNVITPFEYDGMLEECKR